MSETKWTPGPWRVDQELFLFRGYTQISGANHHGLAQVVTRMEHEDDSDEITEELEANARLIAAAPELAAYAECEEARGMSEDIAETVLVRHGFDRAKEGAQEFVDRMRRAALAKARGE